MLAGDRETWSRFYLKVRPRLVRKGLALGLTEQTAEDLAQAFFAKKLLDANEAKMLEPVAAGKCPLLPRILGSFRNYVRDDQRRARRGPSVLSFQDIESGDEDRAPFEPAAPAPSRRSEPSPGTRTLESACRELTSFLRSHAPERPAWYALLLLDARIFFARKVRRLDAEDRDALGFASARIATCLPWTVKEASLRFSPDSAPLIEIWSTLAGVIDDDGALNDTVLCPAVIPVSANTYHKWRQRIREELWKRAPEESDRVVPGWFSPKLRCRIDGGGNRGAGRRTR